MAPFKLQVSPFGFRQAIDKCRLVLDERCHRFFEQVTPVR
jgi:hypothetical protein